MRAYVCRGDVIPLVQDASLRIKERNRPVKYNFATTDEGGATREGRLGFSRGEFAVIYFLLCDIFH